MDWTLEVVVLPVSDINRSIEFYRDQVGFNLDHHTQNEHMNVAQLSPPGSMKGLQLVVADAAAARQELLDRGVQASELSVFTEADGGTFFGFSDPDGNSWAVQEIRARARKPLLPKDHLGGLGEWAGR